MSSCKVLLNSVAAIKEFVMIADRDIMQVWASDGSGTRIRANNQMALMLLELTKPITIEIGSVSEDAEKFFDSISKFMV